MNSAPNYNKDELDPGVVAMVEYFNANGLETSMSCQGHNKTNMSMFWIAFASSVRERDIYDFCSKHFTEFGGLPMNGRFVERLLPGPKGILKRYEYMAATIEAADGDLARWKNDDAWDEISLHRFCIERHTCEGCPNYAMRGCKRARKTYQEIVARQND